MKKTLFTTLALSFVFSGASVFADSDVSIPYTPSVSTVPSVIEKEDSMSIYRGQNMQLRANILIKERINSLNANMKVITADKSLTTEQKNALNGILSTNINGLTALKASIASSTDATTTKSLASSIFTNFRIYGIVIPQVRIEKRIYDLQNHSLKLSDTFLKVQAKIDEYKAAGKDVTVWQKSLDDAKILVANDMNTLANAFTKISALKPSDYGTSSKMVIEQVNADLRSVVKDFNSIKKNLHKPSGMGNLPKNLKGNTKKDTSNVLTGTSWAWVSSTVGGVATSAPSGDKFVVTFSKDNKVNSTTDCNGVGGSYTLGVNNTLVFGPFMSTMMFCEGSREVEYNAQLSKTNSYKIDGSTLTLTNASGSMQFMKK